MRFIAWFAGLPLVWILLVFWLLEEIVRHIMPLLSTRVGSTWPSEMEGPGNKREGNEQQMDTMTLEQTALAPEPPGSVEMTEAVAPVPELAATMEEREDLGFEIGLAIYGLDRRCYFSQCERAALVQVAKRAQAELAEIRALTEADLGTDAGEEVPDEQHL